MAKISIYLDDNLVEDLDNLVANNPDLIKRNRSELFNHLLQQEVLRQKRVAMLTAAAMLEDFNLDWDEEEQNCASIDAEVSG
ncbi:MAG: hypothetical protein ACRC80_21590 [Waterburya sp.]